MLGKFGTQELLIILCIALFIFGPKQLPRLGKTLGQTIRGFKDEIEGENTITEEVQNQ